MSVSEGCLETKTPPISPSSWFTCRTASNQKKHMSHGRNLSNSVSLPNVACLSTGDDGEYGQLLICDLATRPPKEPTP